MDVLKWGLSVLFAALNYRTNKPRFKTQVICNVITNHALW